MASINGLLSIAGGRKGTTLNNQETEERGDEGMGGGSVLHFSWRNLRPDLAPPRVPQKLTAFSSTEEGQNEFSLFL